jgi:hypothetical protein
MGDTEMRREEQGVERAEKDSAAAAAAQVAAAQVAAAQVAAAQVAAAQVAANMYCHCRVVLTRGSHTRLRPTSQTSKYQRVIENLSTLSKEPITKTLPPSEAMVNCLALSSRESPVNLVD